MHEGAAISKHSMLISYSQNPMITPSSQRLLAPDGGPGRSLRAAHRSLTNVNKVYESSNENCDSKRRTSTTTTPR